jgi:hypothetical protein
MKVFVNGKEIQIFQGATVKDIILSYSEKSYKRLKGGFLGVYDRFGFLTEPDGPVMEGQQFYLKVRKKQNENQIP